MLLLPCFHLSLTYWLFFYRLAEKRQRKKKVHLTDSRARLKFHFNVRLHVGWLVGENEEEAGESPFAAISFTDEC